MRSKADISHHTEPKNIKSGKRKKINKQMLRNNGNGAKVRSGSLEEKREGCIR